MDLVWVGVWWMGFVVIVIGFLLVMFFLFGYFINLFGLYFDYLLNCLIYLMLNSKYVIDFIYFILFLGIKYICEERKIEVDRE